MGGRWRDDSGGYAPDGLDLDRLHDGRALLRKSGPIAGASLIVVVETLTPWPTRKSGAENGIVPRSLEKVAVHVPLTGAFPHVHYQVLLHRDQEINEGRVPCWRGSVSVRVCARHSISGPTDGERFRRDFEGLRSEEIGCPARERKRGTNGTGPILDGWVASRSTYCSNIRPAPCSGF